MQPKPTHHSSLSKQGFTLLEMVIIIMILGILFMIAVPAYLNVRTNSEVRACRVEMRQLQDAKEKWAIDNRKSSDARPSIDDLVPTYIKQEPQCPRNGEYDLSTIAEDVECSIPEHNYH